MREPTVADRLKAIRTVEERHRLLNELVALPTVRWTRSQVAFYLPTALASGLDRYFDGERLVGCTEAPFVLDDRVVRELEYALGAVEEFLATAPRVPSEDRDLPPKGDLVCTPPYGAHDIPGQALLALKEEIEEIDRRKPKRYRLSKGRCIGAEGHRFRYLFHWSTAPELFLPGLLEVGSANIEARVGNQGEDPRTFELLVEGFVGGTVDSAKFLVDPSYVARVVFAQLNAQRDRLADLPQVNALFEKPTGGSREADVRPTRKLNPQQVHACRVARGSALAYIWGPPGTGKTTTLGSLVAAEPRHGHRMLVVSPYNVAVDEALLAVARSGNWSQSSLVRVGRVSAGIRSAGLDLDSHLERHAAASGLLESTKDLYRSLAESLGDATRVRMVPASIRGCLEEIGGLIIASDNDPALAPLKRRLKDAAAGIREAYRSPADSVIRSAEIVGTTVTLSFLSPAISDGRFQHLVVDEASVLRLPEAVLLAGRVPERLTFLGDPRQLTSITTTSTERACRWLRPNPFALAGIDKPSDAGGRCVLLLEQHRMAPPIRELVSEFFYEGVLRDGRVPGPGKLVWYDSSITPARATTAMTGLSYSRENLIHRGIVAHLLRTLTESHPDARKLVLCPFRAQKEAYLHEANTNRIPNTRFATVHAAQGTESDIVILDLVVAPGRGRSRFLSERSNQELANLLNVAISRARQQLIIVGHASHILEKYPGLLLDRLLRHVRERGEWIEVPADLRWRPFGDRG